MAAPSYTHPAQAKAEAAREQMRDNEDALFRLVVSQQVGGDWSGDVDPMVIHHWETGLIGVLRQLIENAEQVERIAAEDIAEGDLIELISDGGDRCYEPRRVQSIQQPPPEGDWELVAGVEFTPRITVTFTDAQPPARFRRGEEVWRVTYGEPVEEPAPVWLSPQARAIVAGMLDPEVRKREQESGESQVFASKAAWDEVETAFPVEMYRERVNEEGEIA